MKTLTEFAQEIMDSKNSPHRLAELEILMAGKYAMLSDIAKELQIEKAIYTNNVKFANEKPLSDTSVEAKWRIEESGQKEIRMRYEFRALEKLLSACKSSIYVANNEARNNY